jgi:LexA-binding, inner membrane-associated putative hydrolase
MILGHYGAAFAAKRVVPRSSLGTLAFAAQLLDEVWPIFVLLGIERVRVVPGFMAANPLEFVYYPFSHSLAMAILWGLLVAVVHFASKRDARTALVLGALVVSHWVLDVPVHGRDLPLWPGSDILVGLGAWRSVALTMALELGVFAFGVVSYLRQTRARDRVGSAGLWVTVALLLAVLLSGFGPPPPSAKAVGASALGLWIFVPLMYWVDRHRGLRAEGPGPRE